MLIIITAPSGAGKTSITKYLMQRFPQLAFSVSAATRPQRPGEINGVDYYFLTVEEFHQKIQNNEFIEWEMVYEGKYYGTLKSEIKRIKELKKVPILDIDVKGAIHVQQQSWERSISIFVQPPSIEELRRRLERRGTEATDALQDRINKAAYEISFRQHFDKVVTNDNLDQACREAEAIVTEAFREEGILS